MSELPKSTKRRDLIRRLRVLGWTGPHKGCGPHPQYMAKGTRVVSLPNEHRRDIGEGLLKAILTETLISQNEWLGKDDAND